MYVYLQHPTAHSCEHEHDLSNSTRKQKRPLALYLFVRRIQTLLKLFFFVVADAQCQAKRSYSPLVGALWNEEGNDKANYQPEDADAQRDVQFCGHIEAVDLKMSLRS